MDCRQIEKKLSAYQDNQLPVHEMVEIEQHLKICSNCSQAFQELDIVWKELDQVETIDSAPFFWTRLSQRIEEKKEKQFFSKLTFPLQWIPVPMVTTMVLIFGLFMGVYLGKTIYQQSLPVQQTTIEQEIDQLLSNNSFDDYTGESVTDIYVSLITDNSK